MMINPELAKILAPAYLPCMEFSRSCTEMCWNPISGNVPRGFFGAYEALEDVELILVFAEPGNPHFSENHTGIESAYDYAGNCFKTGKDLFHRNVRKILSLCWPNLSFDKQMRKVWLTESVLCSARIEGGSVSVAASKACGKRYILPQIAKLPNALIVALGRKAQRRLRAAGVSDFLPAFAAAPPGCNRHEAFESWQQISIALQFHKQEPA
jgi:hypothetical protein